jgi:hypothetical protein
VVLTNALSGRGYFTSGCYAEQSDLQANRYLRHFQDEMILK